MQRQVTWVAVVLLCVASTAVRADRTDGAPPSGETTASVLTETVRVTASRLADVTDEIDRVPASVTVISRERIEHSGARDLADLLALEAGFVVYDQTGNDVQRTVDMRGFKDGAGTRVFVDGAPLNDGINNTLALELLPLETLERVEITRGSAAALAGGGAEAGVINLVTRRGGDPGGSLTAAFGTFGASDVGGHLSQTAGPVELIISGRVRESDGFRTNADGDLSRLSATLGFDVGDERRIGLTLIRSQSDFGNPGALTAAELEDDRSASPFNSLDFADEAIELASLSFQGAVSDAFTLATNLFVRKRDTDSLTTGRAAPDFGGFALDSEATFHGSTVQLTHRTQARNNVLAFGGEWLDGETDSRGFATPPDDLAAIPDAPTTDTRSDRTTTALFVQDTWNPAPRWSLSAGARYDRDRIGQNESAPTPGNDASRSFSELSVRGGATWQPDDRHALYVSYGEGFLPPTAQDLFAFPKFGSNPQLDPEDSRTYEVGVRRRFADRARVALALFRIDTDDEIVYDPDSDIGAFGANVNAGKTRRQGVELTLNGRVATRVTWFANVTLTDAEFTAGDNDGKRVPLVPDERLAAGLTVELPAGVTLESDALHVSEQVLDNDDGNTQPALDAYTVANARVKWRPGRAPGRGSGPELFVEARNVFDEEYATRGIYAFDFSSGMNDTFVTPAPGRRYLAGATWDF